MYDSRLSSPRRQWCLVLLLAFTCTATIAFTQARVPTTTARWGTNQQRTVSARAAFFLAQTPLPPRGGGSRLKPRAATRVPSSSTSPSKAGEASFDDEAGLSSSSHSFVEDPSKNRGPLKVLFLSADTGGGHRASAESLAKQFQIHFPGSTYDLLDIWTTDGIKPYSTLVQSYKHLSAHPRQWRFLYHLSNSRPWEIGMDFHSNLTCERRIRKRISSYTPDVVVSVHPAMNYTPLRSLRHLARETGRHIPFYTVVTDLGSGHCTWFHKTVNKLYVASDRIRRLAKRRGGTPDEKIAMVGLPIRNDFAVQAKRMGDRTTEHGREYQKHGKEQLQLNPSKPVILVMGGGEGVGSLSQIVDELFTSLVQRGVDATVCVVCGRNEKLQKKLQQRDWTAVGQRRQRVRKRARLPGTGQRRRCVAILKVLKERRKFGPPQQLGKVDVVGLGFVTNMADYMVAADVLVSKAGPGTIAEAAAVGLPIMLTSFLPGQEAGNVDYVLEYGFGDYCEDPASIGEEVASWLQDESLLQVMSHRAQAAGRPHAAEDIVLDIGSETQVWKALNEKKSQQN